MQFESAVCPLCASVSMCLLCACLVLNMSLWSLGWQTSHVVFTKEVFELLGDKNDCPQVLISVSCCPVPQCQNLLPQLWEECGRKVALLGTSVLALPYSISTVLRSEVVTWYTRKYVSQAVRSREHSLVSEKLLVLRILLQPGPWNLPGHGD